MSTFQDLNDAIAAVTAAKAALIPTQAGLTQANADVEALVTSEQAAVDAAGAALMAAVDAARITVGWQPIATAFDNANADHSLATSTLQQVGAEYDGQ